MKLIWFLAGTAIIAVGIVATRKLLRDNKDRDNKDRDNNDRAGLPGADRHAKQIGALVLEAFEVDWVKRFGVTKEDLRAAVLHAEDGGLAKRVDGEIGVVDLKFDAAGQRRGEIAATIIVVYPQNQATSTAQLTLPWDHVPDSVRAELLRSTQRVVFRKWRAVPGQPVTS